jgi:hypothetical protein
MNGVLLLAAHTVQLVLCEWHHYFSSYGCLCGCVLFSLDVFHSHTRSRACRRGKRSGCRATRTITQPACATARLWVW